VCLSVTGHYVLRNHPHCTNAVRDRDKEAHQSEASITSFQHLFNFILYAMLYGAGGSVGVKAL
jgi:hypothetical protein